MPTSPCCRCRCRRSTRAQLFELGRKLAPLRDEGTLIVGSGFTTHNLRWFNPAAGPDGQPPKASEEFDNWAAEALERQDVDAILDFMHKAPAAHEAHPRTEHWAPLYVSPRRGVRVGFARQRERHRRLLVRPEQALLAVRLRSLGQRSSVTARRCLHGPRLPRCLAHQRQVQVRPSAP